MPAGLNSRKDADVLEGLEGLWNMGAGVMRGGAASMLGAPGDVEELVRTLRGDKSKKKIFATTDDYKWALPKTGKDTETFEAVGEYANPIGPAKKALLASHTIAPAAGAVKAGLYANALRKDLLASHSTKAGDLLREGKLPNELYNLSLGVTKDKPMSFKDGNTLLVAREGAFDPKTSPSVLTAFDSYSPRSYQAHGVRADELAETLREYQKLRTRAATEPLGETGYARMMRLEEELTQRAKSRNVDRFISQNPKGGVMSEGFGKMPPDVRGLPRFGEGGYGKQFNIMSEAPMDNAQMMSYGKRFQTFQDYEKSPLGAARLDAGPASKEVGDKITDFLTKNEDKIADRTGITIDDLDFFDPNSNPVVPQILKALVKADPNSDLTKQAQELARQLRRTKSDYGELKVYGPVGLHKDNFAGIIASPNLDTDTLKLLESEAKRRGLAFGTNSMQGRDDPLGRLLKKNTFDMAQEMQRR